MNCDFELLDGGLFRCRRCDYQTRLPLDRAPSRNCQRGPIVCALRGQFLRDELCRICPSHERLVPIYACPLHRECATSRTRSGTRGEVRQCLTCPDRQAGSEGVME